MKYITVLILGTLGLIAFESVPLIASIAISSCSGYVTYDILTSIEEYIKS